MDGAAAIRWMALGTCALACCLLQGGCQRAPTRTIVLIGGTGSEGPGRHAYADGVRLLAGFLRTLPAARAYRIDSHPEGWPEDPHALDQAAALVLYTDGDARQPLCDPARRNALRPLVERGVGIVVLHQASTVPAKGTQCGLKDWLGAERIGLYDRTTETATLEPAGSEHPALNGIGSFTYRDEFYPTLRFAESGTLTPLLEATLHVQYRDGRAVLDDLAERKTVAWAYQRPDGGRSAGYIGAHFLSAFDQPMVRRLLLNAIVWSAGGEVPSDGALSGEADAAARILAAKPPARTTGAARVAGPDVATFHYDAGRSGWNPDETVLTPAQVASPAFGLLWESPALDAVDGQAPHLYATPLYLDRLAIGEGPLRGETFAAAIVASNNGFVYAISTEARGDIAPGRILWRTRLAQPCRLQPAPLDAVPTGVLATPVADTAQHRLYVTSCDPTGGWQAYALDLASGKVLPGWPVRLDEPALDAHNRNKGEHPVPPTRRFDFRVQRGALNLSPDRSRLYVVFGETETGWLVSVDTRRARIASTFATVAMPHRSSGGVWGAGGPAVDAKGHVHIATGTGFDGYRDQPNDWTQSLLQLSDDPAEGLTLTGTYTPFNHCDTAAADIDLGSGGAAMLPAPGTRADAVPQLLVVGGKQGNAYLLDSARLPGALDRRPPCSTDAARDGSLLPPGPQPQFGGRGPLNVFGPYSQDAALDMARSRSVPASFRDAGGRVHVYMTGNTRRSQQASGAVPPSLVRLGVETASTPWLSIEKAQGDLVFGNPGSPIVSSHGPRDAVVWVLDENGQRSAPLAGAGAPFPVLYAFDAGSLKLLWKSKPGDLATGGKYNEPTVARGLVLVGTDRLSAYGLGAHHLDPAQRSAAAAVPPATRPSASAGLDGAAIYRQRCAMCHDHPAGGIPPREWIAKRSHAQIVHALAEGAMRAQAAGLSQRDIEAVAEALK